jgi:diadenosine tetraphosphate (Ap4A) HIT family hydrolase
MVMVVVVRFPEQTGPCVVPGHCVIVPLEHIVSIRDADEQVRREIARFQDALEKVGEAQVSALTRDG